MFIDDPTYYNACQYIVYRAFRYPSYHSQWRYPYAITMAPDIFLLGLLGILAVRRDLQVFGVLLGYLACWLPHYYGVSVYSGILSYFISQWLCYNLCEQYFWKVAEKKVTRFVSSLLAISSSALAIYLKYVSNDINLPEVVCGAIIGLFWGCVWWKLHNKFAPPIYTWLSKLWLVEMMLFRNTCWMHDLAFFEYHHVLRYLHLLDHFQAANEAEIAANV